ncbi:MAG TPA: ATP-binding cassette domain-containing protein [Hyphomicrobiales bacterium]|nr:ATP-binding cassette domain-containing protein [Hyphomicrobiales bacterium]
MHETLDRPAPAEAASRPPAMELSGIRKSFGPVQALKGVDLAIVPGEVHAVVGENGAGKSTLIGIAAGVLAADAGTITLAGAPVTRPDPRRLREAGVSVVYQHPALALDLTVLENLQLAAPALGAADGAAAAERLLARVATGPLLMPVGQRVAELTLAQRHVVEIARALATNPRVLFLDEPTEPLQQADVRHLFALIGELKAAGVAIVYVSHRLHEVDELADRISVMRDGEIIDRRLAGSITAAEIVTLIAGRPLGQIFPNKTSDRGAALFETRGLSGRGFDQVDLAARAGEIVGLAGVEGEGQREFLRAAAGIDPRLGGAVAVGGQVVGGASPGAFRRAGIGFISDDRHREGVFLSLGLRENLGLGFQAAVKRFGLIDRAAEARRAEEIATGLAIRAASIEAQLSQLSGGNQQKALFGREIAAEPTVLLVDEPTKGVDIGARSEIYQRLRAFAERGLAVVVSSSDGIELEGLCDRVLIFARGRVVQELDGAAVSDAAITEANLTATVSRTAADGGPARRGGGWHALLSGDHFPAIVLAVLTALILGLTQAFNPYFLSAFNVHNMLFFLAILTFLSIAQLATILVGAIDLSVGALAGLCVVAASFLAPDGAGDLAVAGGSIAVVLGAVAFGALQGVVITYLRLPAIVVTIATFIGLQGVSLLLRPTAAGDIAEVISDAAQAPVLFLPASMWLTIAVVVALEFLLFRTGIGRRYRAVGSNPLASLRLGIDARRLTLLAFALSGLFSGIGGMLLAGQVAIGSPSVGTDYTLMSITVVVLGGASVAGGRGSILATLLGAALVQATSSASSFIDANSAVHYAVIGTLTILAAIFFSLARRHRTAAPRAAAA